MAADLNLEWICSLPRSWTYGITRGGRVFFINEEAKSTTWLHPVTGEAVVTGHRRQSTGNAAARPGPRGVGLRREEAAEPRPPASLPRYLPRAAGPWEAARWGGGRRGRPQVEGVGGANAGGLPWSLRTPLSSAPDRRQPAAPSAPSQTAHPPPPTPVGWPTPLSRESWGPELFLPRPLLSPPAAPRPPCHLLGSPFPLPSCSPGILPPVRRENVSTTSRAASSSEVGLGG